jgi:hypothetical protein
VASQAVVFLGQFLAGEGGACDQGGQSDCSSHEFHEFSSGLGKYNQLRI